MNPVRLALTDFLSYRQADLDLGSVDVACLTGANGQGKSSLLDAITWALFGAARGCEGGQHQERLIRDGAQRATVELGFDLDGQTYRLTRSRARNGRSDLRFDVRSASGWTSLAGETMRDTEARVSDVLRLDYRTFTASAFFLQGRADDFLTRMRPEDRKEVFARLLDLGAYERLESAARSRARDAEQERKVMAAQVEKLGPLAAERARVAGELECAQQRRDAAREAVEQADREADARRDELRRLEASLEMAGRERAAVEELRARLDASRHAVQRKDAELADLDELLARSSEVQDALAEHEQLRAADEACREAAAEHARLSREQAEAIGAIEAEARVLRERADQRIRQAQELEQEADGRESVEEALAKAEGLVEESAAVESVLRETDDQIAELLEQDAKAGGEIESLARRIQDVQERLQLVELGEGECPVCAGPLSGEHRERLRGELQTNLREAREAAGALESRRGAIRKDGRRLREEQQRLREVARQREQLVREAAQLRSRVESARIAAERAATLRAEAQRDEEVLAGGAFGQELRSRLATIEAALAALAYDRSEHEGLRSRLAELESYRSLEGRIAQAASRRDVVAAEQQDVQRQIRQWEHDLADRSEAVEQLESVLTGAAQVRARVEQAVEDARRLRAGFEGAAAELARLDERMASLDRADEELVAARAAEREAAGRNRQYTRLAQAFGRGGIPDLVIENVLPELTQEANDLLGRLTDYDMSVQFAMSRETKSGKVKETFDVLVHHDGGVRDYSMFSGGEAFRIAFAIRLALSKLLVRRAGARLETLVIDEGFGSQDASGRERLVQVINLARAEFRKVLVITHLEDLKDAFGAQIRVAKDPVAGSVATLSDG